MISLMDRIIFETEADELYVKYLDAARLPPEGTTESAITVSARVTAQTLKDARAIVSYTMSGATASRVSRERPYVPVLCMTPDIKVARRMSLLWGIESVVSAPADTLNDVARKANCFCQRLFNVKPGDKLIITAGLPFNIAGNTNILQIINVSPLGEGDLEFCEIS